MVCLLDPCSRRRNVERRSLTKAEFQSLMRDPELGSVLHEAANLFFGPGDLSGAAPVSAGAAPPQPARRAAVSSGLPAALATGPDAVLATGAVRGFYPEAEAMAGDDERVAELWERRLRQMEWLDAQVAAYESEQVGTFRLNLAALFATQYRPCQTRVGQAGARAHRWLALEFHIRSANFMRRCP